MQRKKKARFTAFADFVFACDLRGRCRRRLGRRSLQPSWFLAVLVVVFAVRTSPRSCHHLSSSSQRSRCCRRYICREPAPVVVVV